MIYIRLEGDEKIGLGHFIRMSGLCEEFQIRGENFRFLIREGSMLIPLLRSNAFGFMEIPANIEIKEEPEWINENLRRNDILIIDYFEADRLYLSKLSDKLFIMLVDNLEDPTLPCNLYLHSGNYAEKYRELLKAERIDAMLGTEYVILRTQFRDQKERIVNENARSLLITMGGADVLNLTESVCNASYDLFEEINVIIGSAFKRVPDLTAYKNIKVNKDVSDMRKFMENADLCVSAGGTTIYELASTGLPSITYVVASNQAAQNRVFHKEGTLISLGDGKNFDRDRLRENIINLKADFEKRKEMARRGQSLVDGKGTERVAEGLIKYYNLWRN